MHHRTRFYLASAVIASLCLAYTGARSQDYPTHRGTNQRVGHTVAPLLASPGLANLRWWHPDSTEFNRGGFVRDNTSSLTTRVETWSDPTSAFQSLFSFIPTKTGNATEDALISSFFDPVSPNYNHHPIAPEYQYTTTVASRWTGDFTTYDPTVPASGNVSSFTWDVTPTNGLASQYGVYVWVTAGGTDISGTGADYRYPQRYFVYSVQYGAGKKFIDVIDTEVSGNGWVRIGGGGRSTDKVFTYDGTGSITVTLYNTVPRDKNGELLGAAGSTLVYADGALVQSVYGNYSASPVASLLSDGITTSVVSAVNMAEIGTVGGVAQTIHKGIVSSYQINNGTLRWRFSPLDESETTVNLDMPSPTVTVNPGWTASTTASRYQGTNYYSAALAPDVLSATDVVYNPKLADGDYDIYVWVAGSNNGVNFATETAYQIDEGSTSTTVYVNQDTQRGWVRLGTRRYDHKSTAKLVVHALNYSNEASDIVAGRVAYADAVRFVGATSLSISSTPIQVNGALIKMDTNPINPAVATDVTIVAAENGRIYCLDSMGNADGTTNVYWTYPSTPDPNNASWTDPNQVAGEDGTGGIAEMPSNTGFSTSSGLVQRIGGKDYLYIAAQNGRVYCIDVAGRGDFNTTTRRPGTTTRVWTYPDDYPGTPKASSLGAFTGSLTYANTASGPTIFVPAPQGRIYALNAEAQSTTNKTTSVRWQYPAATAQTLGAISMTPAIDFGRIYFGTAAKDDSENGQFYALNIDNGDVVWKFEGTTAIPTLDFMSSPAVVPASFFDNPTHPQGNTVFAANDNHYIYALDADGNGDGTTNVRWSTNELGVSVRSGLSYIPLNVAGGSGATATSPAPILIVPTLDGRIVGLFADTQANLTGTKRAYEFLTNSSFTASVANAVGWMFAGDTDGRLMAFNTGSGYLSPGGEPGTPSIVENDPTGATYRDCKVKLITLAQYQQLVAGTMTYAQADALPEIPGTPPAFEWGQTIYALVYNFPYDTTSPGGNTVAPPIVNFTFSVAGGNARVITMESRMFQHVGADNPPVSIFDNTLFLDGYSVIPFVLQNGGGMSLAPGNGQMTFGISTYALNDSGVQQAIAMDVTKTRKDFTIANPLAVLMNGTGDPMRAVGYTTDPTDVEAKMNGSRYIGSGTKRQDLLLASIGIVPHNQSASTTIQVVDRSLMTLLRGPGKGLENVRYTRSDLNWTGGAGAVFNALDPTLYPDYEDLPTRFPNDSLDYPDIQQKNISVVKDIFGNSENPLFSGASLLAPTIPDLADPTVRTLTPTPFDIKVNIPKYQPFNATGTIDSTGSAATGGYIGRHFVFVDSSGTGSFFASGGGRNAYRSFRVGVAVDKDENLKVLTPTVDLGSLSQGAGYAPAYPWDVVNSPLAPLAGPYKGLWQPFKVTTSGNTNVLNIRLAKQTQAGIGAIGPWPIYSTNNEYQAWLETLGNVYTTMDDDSRWLVVDDNGNAHHYVVLPKARVGDRVDPLLDINTVRRANTVTGVAQGRLNSLRGSVPPMIAAAIPIGFPVGSYSQVMRVIAEDSGIYPANEALSLDSTNNGLEIFSDPTFNLKFNVVEGRLTNNFSSLAAPMIDNPSIYSQANPRFQHTNMQPTGLRTPLGSLVFAWASTRANWTEDQPGDTKKLDDQWRIYVASLQGTTPGAVGGPNPLRELQYSVPNSNASWFRQSTDAPFPTCTNVSQANTLFNVDTANSEAVLFDTVKFGAPSLPSHGYSNPLGNFGDVNNGAYMAFLGEAQVSTQTGRLTVSKLFIAPMTTNAQGAPTLGTPALFANDDGNIRKSKPSVVQVGDRATIFFSGGASGKTQIMYTTYNPNGGTPADRWSQIVSLPLGTGFEYAFSPSIWLRRYAGVDYAAANLTNGQPIIDMSFVGKLRGRPTAEVFFGRLLADENGAPLLAGTTPRFAYLPPAVLESLVSTSDPSVFQAGGVGWNTRYGITLQQSLNGTVTNLEVADSRTFDQTTGILSFKTTLGGKVYIDTNIGTVRFANAIPSNKATILLSYQARFMRVSETGVTSGCTSSEVLFDNRQGADSSYWVRPDGSPIRNNDTDAIRASRYVFTFTRGASGQGQTARPYLRPLRIGVQCPTPIGVDANGFVVGVTVTGNSGPYQIDAPSGRIYFTDVDEYRTVHVSYTDANGGSQSGDSLVALVQERKEAPIAIEKAVNEAGVWSFLDPLQIGGQIGIRRPGLIWLLWSSTRGGSPDLFFETIAPRFSAIPAGN